MMDQQGEFCMIVDDEPDMLWVLENLLARQGLTAKKALSGRQALQLIESYRFKMAFIDLKLPDMDGFELAHHIKSKDPDTCVVLISGYFYKNEQKVLAAIDEGLICDFISKPFSHEDIRRALSRSPLVEPRGAKSEESVP